MTGEDSCLKLQANFQGRNSYHNQTDEARKLHLLVTGYGVSLYANSTSCIFVTPQDLPNLEPMLCIVPLKQTALSGSGVSRYANGASCIFVIPDI